MTNDATHTSGPWFRSGEDNQIRAKTQDGHTTICEILTTDKDAQLISAAPGLLEAVIEGLAFLTGDDPLDRRAYEQMEATFRFAIAEATGE